MNDDLKEKCENKNIDVKVRELIKGLEKLNKENNENTAIVCKLFNDFINTSSTEELSEITKRIIKYQNKIMENIKLGTKLSGEILTGRFSR
jgi:uncharacterized protein YPO0396